MARAYVHANQVGLKQKARPQIYINIFLLINYYTIFVSFLGPRYALSFNIWVLCIAYLMRIAIDLLNRDKPTKWFGELKPHKYLNYNSFT